MKFNKTLLLSSIVFIGAIWRLFLMGRYAGWEESDYGNLAMVRGVLDGGFLHYDMNHMPGYYALGAVGLWLTGDTIVGARGASWLGGVVALALSVLLTQRLAGITAAVLAGVLLVIQPEFSLYAASSLREPVYAAFVVAVLWMLHKDRLGWAGFFLGCGFLVRFDALLALLPAVLIHVVGRAPRPHRLMCVLVPVGLMVGLWSLYCRVDHGTALFWSHAVSVNVETGLGGEAMDTMQWLVAGAKVSGALLFSVLPSRLGWGIWVGMWLSFAWALFERPGLRRTWNAMGLGMLGVWAGIGLVGQHEPGHNLYWKWLCPIIPLVVPLGVDGVLRLLQRFQPAVRGVLIGAVMVQSGVAMLQETHRQWSLSEELYRPQLDLAQLIEDEVPEDDVLLVDNIPACWMNRTAHSRTLISWFDVPSTPGDPEAFSEWILEEDVKWVLWFREPWTQAPGVAPFLDEGGVWSSRKVLLIERDREDGYGWIWYEVEHRPERMLHR